MPKIGCHGSVWTGTFNEAGFRMAVEQTKAAGFDLIELPLFDPFHFDAPAGRRIIDEYGLAVNGSLGLGDATDISSEREDSVAAGEALLGAALDVLSELGGEHLVGVLYGALKKHMGPATQAGRTNGLRALRRIASRAESLGITVGLEVVNRYETNIMNTAKEASAYVTELGHENVFIHLDTYHMNIEEPDMIEPVLVAGERLGYVHIGESHRGYLGSGTVDFDAFFRGLALTRYDGPIVFESFSSTVVDENLSNALGIWRNLWDNSADLASHANSFIRNKLRAVETISLH
jgi:D-psicose/D-tagatose/L-ribulose 3-epimerase